MITVKNLSKHFGGIKAVDCVDLHINKGSITGLVGPNGAGKTSMFNLIAGLYQPTEGEIILDGEDVTDLTSHQLFHKGLLRTFQIAHEFPTLSVLETEPIESLIDIYWETSTSGLISELNESIRSNDPNAPSYIVDWNFDLDESDGTGTLVSTSSFQPKNSGGEEFSSLINVVSIEDLLGNDRSSDFTLVGNSNDGYNFEIASSGFVYGFDGDKRENYKFKLSVINNSASPAVEKEMTLTGKLDNVAPTIDSITVPSTYVGMPNPILTLTGENGSVINDTQGLSWAFSNGLQTFTKSINNGYGELTFSLSHFYRYTI